MRIVTLEEHVVFPEIAEEITRLATDTKQTSAPESVYRQVDKLADVTGDRLKSMDENGITLQVLSVVGAGANLVAGAEGIRLAKKYNDQLAEKIKDHPKRFAAFAHLPMMEPQAAAEELERTVTTYGFVGAMINGMTNGEFLDDEKYAPIFEMAERMDVPIYLHPGMPPKAVADVYYSNLPKYSGMLLSIAGWGWHSETALHVLRLIVAGVFDRYPKLKLIIGHMGEMLPMMMDRCSKVFQPEQIGINKRTVEQTLKDQVYITTSGLFTEPPLRIAIDTLGIDRILSSVDYPFSPNEVGTKFLKGLSLSEEDMAKLTHGNADKLLKISS
jgi:predicted TIM-barrel fold metal-dependent hydrolase